METLPIHFPQANSRQITTRKVFTNSGLGTRPKKLCRQQESQRFQKILRQTRFKENRKQLTAGTGDDIQPKWTPDAQSILFVRSSPASRQAGAG